MCALCYVPALLTVHVCLLVYHPVIVSCLLLEYMTAFVLGRLRASQRVQGKARLFCAEQRQVLTAELRSLSDSLGTILDSTDASRPSQA